MKIKATNLILPAFLCMVIVFSSCNSRNENGSDEKSRDVSTGTVTSKELVRDDVQKILRSSFGLPKNIVRGMPSGDLYVQTPWPNQYERALVNMGYRIIHSESSCEYTTNVVIEFTDKASQYIQNKTQLPYSNFTGTPLCNAENVVFENLVIVASVSDVEVLTLRKISESEYEAEIKLSPVFNDIGNMYFQNNGALTTSRLGTEVFQNQKIKILKYDDGWKAEQEKINRMSKWFEPSRI